MRPPRQVVWSGRVRAFAALGVAALVYGLLLTLGLGSFQILPVNLFGNRADVAIFPNSLDLNFPVEILVDAQGNFCSHVLCIHPYVYTVNRRIAPQCNSIPSLPLRSHLRREGECALIVADVRTLSEGMATALDFRSVEQLDRLALIKNLSSWVRLY